MSAPDGPPDDLEQHIEAVSSHLRQAVNAAWYRGLRDGMEVGAQICVNLVEPLFTLHGPGYAAVAQGAADSIRLMALQSETPQ